MTTYRLRSSSTAPHCRVCTIFWDRVRNPWGKRRAGLLVISQRAIGNKYKWVSFLFIVLTFILQQSVFFVFIVCKNYLNELLFSELSHKDGLSNGLIIESFWDVLTTYSAFFWFFSFWRLVLVPIFFLRQSDLEF